MPPQRTNRVVAAVFLTGILPMPMPAPAQTPDLYAPIHAVLQHPRCSNCHSGSDQPLQRDGRAHVPEIRGGPEGRGVGRLLCSNCHKDRNTAGAPGAPDWRMPVAAPDREAAAFRGRPAAVQCRLLRDPARNGGLQPEALGRHFMEDPLIAWAWQPGIGRSRPAETRERLVAAVAGWLRAGAPCPPP